MKKRRLLAIILIMVLTINIVPLHVLATGESDEVAVVDRGTDNDVTWTFYSNGHLLVEGTGRFFGEWSSSGENYRGPYWGEHKEKIKTATVKGYGMDMTDCFFRGCKNLVSVDFSEWDTSEVSSMTEMFAGCSSLTSLDLGDLEFSEVTYMDGMFQGCSSLKNLKWGDTAISTVMNASYMFSGCSSLTDFNLENFNTAKLKNTSYMFENCTALTTLDLSNFDTSQVTDMSNMFDGCSALKSVDLSNFDTAKVKNIGSMFANCSSIEELNLSGFDMTSLSSSSSYYSNVFSGCSSLHSLKTPYNVSRTIDLPSNEMGAWTDEANNIYTTLPEGQDKSIELHCGIWPERIENISGYSISLEGDVVVNFYMQLSDSILSDDEAYMQFVKPNGSVSKVMVSAVSLDEATGNYKFPCVMSVAEMNDSVTAQIITSAGDTQQYVYSVKKYADYILSHTDVAAYKAAVPLVKAMLNYGGYSQEYFGHNADALANGNLYSDTDDPVLTETVTIDDAYIFTAPQDDIGLKYYGSSLLLNSKTTVRHYFTITGEETLDDVKANYAFTLSDGTMMTPKMNRGMVSVDIININAAELDNIFTLTVSNGTDTFDISYSPFSYAKYVLEYSLAREHLVNVIKAMYWYNQAANEYFV